MKVLLLFASRDGQTAKIAQVLAAQLQQAQIVVTCHDLKENNPVVLSQYQLVILGSSVRYGHFHPEFTTFIQQHYQALNSTTTGFFAVNLTARKAEKSTPMTNGYVVKFLQKSPWQPNYSAVFAGALRYPRYRWWDKWMIQLIMKMTGGVTDTQQEIEYTNWHRVKEFGEHCIILLQRAGIS